MTTPLLTSPASEPIGTPLKKKRVLLVDTSTAKRDLRAEVMRKLGIDVDCAADLVEARSWWRADLYNLVLIDVENELGKRDKFCDDMRSATPPQQLAFLVGKPEFLADAPSAEEVLRPSGNNGASPKLTQGAPSSDGSSGVSQRWGILEASRRISEVRSASHARTQAMRERSAPPRDAEGRPSRHLVEDRALAQLSREELQ
jgi:CheY-like chemotaxis protein